MSATAATSRIQILPPDVISRIAAGEVVERPAAVVKELIDNSLDAGSTHIAVEVTDGGRGMIRVTDNGVGMSRADASLAFERHATSKVRSEKDLWSLTTLGFRGEALPSIASVSNVRLLTASREEPVGVRLVMAGGRITKMEEAAAAPGTQVEVADLFFNTPARKKFLKAPATEFSHICQVVQQAALAWPGTHLSLQHGGQQVLDYAAVSSLRDRVLQIYGLRCVEQMVEVRADRPGVRLEGFTVSALHLRSARSPQDLFVNRRPIKNATITHALYDGYGEFLVKGRHPVFVLLLEIDPDRVDVNVHPTKREVRFSDQELIHQTVRRVIRQAVGGSPAEAHAHRDLSGSAGGAEGQTVPAVAGRGSGRGQGQGMAWTAPAAQGSLPLSSEVRGQGLRDGDRALPPSVQEAAPVYGVDQGSEVLPLGQIRRTFLVALAGSELQVIDQHTAHERVLFERLCRAWNSQSILAQPLLIPEPIDLPPHRAALLRSRLPDLETLGLQIEAFGGQSFLIRSVPALLGHLDLAALLQDLLDDLSQWNAASSLEQRVRPVLASLACHGAVRAGRVMESAEIKQLIQDWIAEGFPMTCPHGRRVALRFPEDELGRMFGRI